MNTYLVITFVALAVFQVIIEPSSAANIFNDPVFLCSNVTCLPADIRPSRVGQECRVLSSGLPECVCRRHCPKSRKPICGSDGALYESYCDLYRHACIKGESIYPNMYNKSCKSDPLSKLKHDVEKELQEIKNRERDQIRVPRACHQNERDRMREYLMSWMLLSANKNFWYKKGMTKQTIYSEYYQEIDSDLSKYIDSPEWLHHLRNKSSSTLRDKASRKLRKLCIETLVEEADLDQDWRLSIKEFLRLMSDQYQPSIKYCVRDHRHFEDGTRTKVDCNGCTCACGKWICTSHLCSYGSHHFMSTEDYGLYDIMDNQID